MLIVFKTKIEFGMFKIPNIQRHHIHFNEGRPHKRLEQYSNSDLFKAMLHKHMDGMGLRVGKCICTDAIPPHITIENGFLSTIIIEIFDDK